jgi:carotenoid cleavage dioxygenase-like enzyme
VARNPLAMKEDGPPFAMDPVTLETIGRYDFEGLILAPTFTAHPKSNPMTGEMVCLDTRLVGMEMTARVIL